MGERREWVSWWVGLAAAGAILFGFALWQLGAPNGDLYQYRCFALAFWHGSAATAGIPQCAGRLPAAPFPAFHVLPREYPPLALVVFSAPLLLGGAASMTLYVLGFNALMLACLGGTAWLLRGAEPTGQGGRHVAGWYVLWLALGGATIALVRYDAVPALLSAAAIVRARRGPSRVAYVLLALGTLLKLYPLLLLGLLAVWDWRRHRHAGPNGWVWLTGPALAAAVAASIQITADALTGAWGVPWLAVQGARPPQIESTAAGLLWLVEVIEGRGGQVHAVNAERALALVGAPGGALATATLCLALLAIAWAAWALAAGRIAPERALAGSLLALLGGAAIFSPQYLIWAAPLVALALVAPMNARRTDSGINTATETRYGSGHDPAMNGWKGRRMRAILWGWSLVCAATTLIYSVGYLLGWPGQTGWALAPFMALVLLRDGAVWWVAALLLATPRTEKHFRSRVPARQHAQRAPAPMASVG